MIRSWKPPDPLPFMVHALAWNIGTVDESKIEIVHNFSHSAGCPLRYWNGLIALLA
jgi:hypothetical protein